MKTNNSYAIFFVLLLVLMLSTVFAVTRDLNKEALIKSAIQAHKTQKQKFSDNVGQIFDTVAIPMIVEANRLASQAKVIRKDVDAYLKDIGATELQVEAYLNIVDDKLDQASLERKARSLELFKAVCLLVSEEISDVKITDPNIVGN